MERRLKVAVIGAGMAGLSTARELLREGHQVVVFEKANNQLGGTWVYDPRVDSDPLGLDPNREVVHSRLYHSLRVNLPRHLMGFLDYPFSVTENGDPRAFPGHQEVLRFLNDFARDFGLIDLIRFGHEVTRVERLMDHKWAVECLTKSESFVDTFQAVVICNGKYTEPKLADFSAALLIELQSKLVAKVLSGKVALPTEEEMANSVQDFYQQMDEMANSIRN